jgi:hypothetical protein
MQNLTGQQSHTCDGSAEFDRLVTQRDWKRCPGRRFYLIWHDRQIFLTTWRPQKACGAVVEQDGGCRHMTVRPSVAAFC